MPFDSETGRKAGQMSKRTPGTRQPNTKQTAWQTLGLKITGTMTGNIARYQAELWKAGKKDEYLENYLSLLSYFKPKLQANAIKQETEITIKLVHPDDDLMSKI